MNFPPLRKEGMMRNSIRFLHNILRAPGKQEPVSGAGSAKEYGDLKRHISSDIRTVIDVGAHIGEFARFARKCLPAAKIICIEPNENACGLLEEKMNGDPLLTIHACAAGEREEILPLHMCAFSPVSSMLFPTGLLRRYFPYLWGWSVQSVPVRRLDDILAEDIQSPILLKIDVQGYEDRVLRGAEKLLQHASVVIIEISYLELYREQVLAGEITELLAAYGFKQAGIHGELKDWLTGRKLQADAVFVK